MNKKGVLILSVVLLAIIFYMKGGFGLYRWMHVHSTYKAFDWARPNLNWSWDDDDLGLEKLMHVIKKRLSFSDDSTKEPRSRRGAVDYGRGSEQDQEGGAEEAASYYGQFSLEKTWSSDMGFKRFSFHAPDAPKQKIIYKTGDFYGVRVKSRGNCASAYRLNEELSDAGHMTLSLEKVGRGKPCALKITVTQPA